MGALIGDYDAFISPSLAGEAPVGFGHVRGANFSRLWTQMYMPAVNLPLFAGPNGLPVCFQVIGPSDSDDRTLSIAAWIDARAREALGDVPASV
jgi:Asp-tRNA(Asn)/Glu-tRNA(Gln) amidotransferase A subunit family amidase